MTPRRFATQFRMPSPEVEMKPEQISTLSRFIKFTVAGSSGILVDTAVLFAIVEWSPVLLPLALSKAIAAEVAIINNFFWNDRWTFADRHPEDISSPTTSIRFLKFNLICSLGLVIAVAALYILHKGLNVNLYLANVMAIVTAALWNFILSNYLTWTPTNQVSNHRSTRQIESGSPATITKES